MTLFARHLPHPVRAVRRLYAAACLSLVPLSLAPAIARGQSVCESLGEDIFRFHADTAASAQELPSIALAAPVGRTGPVATPPRTRPEFSMAMGVRFVKVRVEAGTSLYGTGEAAGPLLRNGRSLACWNTDAYDYGDDSRSLYQSHPWVLGVRADGSAFGVLVDTPGRVIVDCGSREVVFRAQGPPFPVIVIERPTPQGVVAALADLTGHMELPPKWALGYQQCRYSYYPAGEVLSVARGFRERKIPCDVMWLDIDYMDGYRCFTFSPRGFADPKGLTDSLHAAGFHSVAILDPGIKAEPGFKVYDSGTSGDHWVRTGTGEPYVGRVWPGECVFPDFTRAATRAWWAGLCRDFVQSGIDGLWNDMNEPAVFDVLSKTMPEGNRHAADGELGGPGAHSRYHNVYGMQMARASREGLLEAHPDRRPFVLSRANYLGGQRYAAAWTGDNRSDWEHLRASIPMSLNLGLSGQPFSGSDLGGFAGTGYGRLYARWIGFGALLPFARAHAEKGSVRKEPWSWGPEVEATCRRGIQTRYRLLPYLYTLFREAAQTGVPVMRPLFFADPADRTLREEDEEFLLGADLLVVPQLREDRDRDPLLPKGRWTEVAFAPAGGAADGVPARAGASLEPRDPDLPRLFLRGGAILPAGPVMQHVDERPPGALELVVSLDGNGRAEGTLYEDAGDGFGYRKGEYRLTRFRAEAAGSELRVTAERLEGELPAPAARRYVVTLAGEGAAAIRRVVGP